MCSPIAEVGCSSGAGSSFCTAALAVPPASLPDFSAGQSNQAAALSETAQHPLFSSRQRRAISGANKEQQLLAGPPQLSLHLKGGGRLLRYLSSARSSRSPEGPLPRQPAAKGRAVSPTPALSLPPGASEALRTPPFLSLRPRGGAFPLVPAFTLQ